MGHPKKIFIAALAVALITGTSFLGDGYAKAQGLDFENIPSPNEKGPYNVGIRKYLNVPVSALPNMTAIQVFYPTDPTGPTLDTNCPDRYTIEEPLPVVPGLPPQTGTYMRSSPLCAVENAPAADGMFPLVVFDHGGNPAGADYQRISQVLVHETLASHGFVVVAIRHSLGAVKRVQDLPRVIDFMMAKSATPSDPLFGSIDFDRIGISGTSTGGRSCLGFAGGWAAQGLDPYEGLAPGLQIKAMVLYEPGRDNTLADVSTISIPYLVMGGSRVLNGTVVVPEVFDATVLATPRIRVFNPEALHFGYVTDVCTTIEETREAALAPPEQGGDPTFEPLTNMITDPAINPQTGECFKNPAGLCRRICDPLPNITDSHVRATALRACGYWNFGEIIAATIGPIEAFGFGGGRNMCNRVGVGVNSNRSLDTHPQDGFTDSFLGGDPLVSLYQPFDPPYISNESTEEPAMPQEVLVPMVKLYTVAFFKKFLEGDARYMRYLTPGYANTQRLEAEVEIRE